MTDLGFAKESLEQIRVRGWVPRGTVLRTRAVRQRLLRHGASTSRGILNRPIERLSLSRTFAQLVSSRCLTQAFRSRPHLNCELRSSYDVTHRSLAIAIRWSALCLDETERVALPGSEPTDFGNLRPHSRVDKSKSGSGFSPSRVNPLDLGALSKRRSPYRHSER